MRYAHSLGSMSSAKMDGKLRSPLDYINIVLQIIEHLLSWNGPENEATAKIPYLVIESSKKIQRVFIVKDCQIVSFAFPFQVYDKTDSNTGLSEWHVRYKDIDISPKILSQSRVFYNDYDSLKDKMSFWEIANAQNLSDPDMQKAIRLFEILMLIEPAYVRYDYDPRGKKGLKHPLNHFDHNFIDGFHFKLGLHGRINLSNMEDMFNKDTDCWYVAKYRESVVEKQKRLKSRLVKFKKKGSKRRK